MREVGQKQQPAESHQPTRAAGSIPDKIPRHSLTELLTAEDWRSLSFPIWDFVIERLPQQHGRNSTVIKKSPQPLRPSKATRPLEMIGLLYQNQAFQFGSLVVGAGASMVANQVAMSVARLAFSPDSKDLLTISVVVPYLAFYATYFSLRDGHLPALIRLRDSINGKVRSTFHLQPSPDEKKGTDLAQKAAFFAVSETAWLVQLVALNSWFIKSSYFDPQIGIGLSQVTCNIVWNFYAPILTWLAEKPVAALFRDLEVDSALRSYGKMFQAIFGVFRKKTAQVAE